MDNTFQQHQQQENNNSPGFRSAAGGGLPLAGTRGRTSLSGSPAGSIRKLNQISTPYGALMKSALHNSRFSISARSTNQSMLGIRSDCSMVESYGVPLPIVVKEALNIKDGSQSLTINIAKNGWCWLVRQRRLLVWQYKDTTGDNQTDRNRSIGAVSQCRELMLPPSDIGHKASLVSITPTDAKQTATCISVTATGDVRYWPSIVHNNVCIDTNNILVGQEFEKLIDLPHANGYLLVTTTCNLIFLQVRGNNKIEYKTVKQPTGFLGGFSRRLSSMIIGVNNTIEKEQCFVSMAYEGADKGESIVAVLSDRSLQRWSFSNRNQAERLIYEDSDILRKIRDEFKQKIWNLRMPTDNFEIDVHLLDMHTLNGKIYMLASAVNLNHTPQMYYSIVILSPGKDSINLESFLPLKLIKFYSQATEQDCIGMRFILSRTHLYIYSHKLIYPIGLNNISPTTDLEAEKVEFHLHDDFLLNAEVYGNMPLFFSRTHGIVSVMPSDYDSNDYMDISISNTIESSFRPISVNESMACESTIVDDGSENNLFMYELDPDDLYREFKDEVSHLKAAFIYRVKRNNNMMTSIVNDLLKNIAEKESQAPPSERNKVVPELDRIVITIAEDLAEDLPISDPRWEEYWGEQLGSKHALGSSKSMQILTQLQDKISVMKHFIEFLHFSGLWEKLRAVPSSGSSELKPTCYVLSDLTEKIIAAAALRQMQINKFQIIDEAIEHVVEQWNEHHNDNLTAQDFFFVKLCKFQGIFEALADIASGYTTYNPQTLVASSVANIVYEINVIVLEVIGKVFQFREQSSIMFKLPANKLDSYEYLPWTAMSGTAGIRDAFSRFIDISVRFGAQCASEVDLKQKLYQQILELIDIILDGRKNYLDSVKDTEKYNLLQQQFESQRRDLISILIDNNQYELATKLAEKYLDFQSLILICDVNEDEDRLNEYIKRFEEFNFSQFAINWHLRQNRQAEVFERFKHNQAALSQFMRDHPTLGWLQLIFNGDFERAAKILFQLAQNETEFVQRKKSILSLAKLAAFAAPDSDLTEQVQNINNELTIIEYQESLGENILEAFGYDFSNQKVLKVEEIINLFICEENDTATESEFRKALELVKHMEEPYDARHKIWCAAILRDNWIEYDTDKAMSYIQNLLFFKLTEYCHFLDGEVDLCLPSIDDFLHSSELSDLTDQKQFQFLLKMTYEYINDTFRKHDDMMDLQ